MRTRLLLVSCVTVLGCQYVTAPTPPPPPPPLTAELARDALLDLIRREPDLFAGNPLPERLAQLPIHKAGAGKFTWNAFTIDPVAKTYSAEIGLSGPAPYFYNGNFELRENTWIAAKPNILHMHQPLPTAAP